MSKTKALATKEKGNIEQADKMNDMFGGGTVQLPVDAALTSGFCYGREGTHILGQSKLKELKALLDEIGDRSVIIWCNFQQEVELLLREIPDSVALWGGREVKCI